MKSNILIFILRSKQYYGVVTVPVPWPRGGLVGLAPPN